MNTITLIITAVLCIALAGISALLLIRIRNNVITGLNYRRALQSELSKLRLYKMLGALGINIQGYIHQEPIIDIHDHMERCKSCANADICEDKLVNNMIDKDDFEFCSNADAFGAIIKQQGKTD